MAKGTDPDGAARFAIGIDVGTSAVKGAVLASDGGHRGYASDGYVSTTRNDGWAQQQPDDWWKAVGQVLDRILEEHPGLDATNCVIGLTGQMHTTVVRDASGELLRPAILWSDSRSGESVAALREAVADWEEIAGYQPIPAFTSAHLRWIRDNEPDVFGRIASVSVPKDDIRRRLGAGWATEPSDASAMNLLDTRTDRWSAPLLAAVGLAETMLPAVVPSAEVTGVIRSLPPMGGDGDRLIGARVIAGAGDQAAQAYALGAVRDHEIAISVGTSGAALQATTAPRRGAFRHCVPGTWLALDSTHAAGLALAWWSTVAGLPIESIADASTESTRDLPVFLPYLQGGRSHDGAPGTLTDLRASHSAQDILHAVAEGVGIELVRLVHQATVGRLPDQHIGVGGRAARNGTIRSVLAAGLERPIRYADRGPAQGVAALAADSAGWLGDHVKRRQDADEITPVDRDFAVQLRPRIERYAYLVDQLS